MHSEKRAEGSSVDLYLSLKCEANAHMKSSVIDRRRGPALGPVFCHGFLCGAHIYLYKVEIDSFSCSESFPRTDRGANLELKWKSDHHSWHWVEKSAFEGQKNILNSEACEPRRYSCLVFFTNSGSYSHRLPTTSWALGIRQDNKGVSLSPEPAHLRILFPFLYPLPFWDKGKDGTDDRRLSWVRYWGKEFPLVEKNIIL